MVGKYKEIPKEVQAVLFEKTNIAEVARFVYPFITDEDVAAAEKKFKKDKGFMMTFGEGEVFVEFGDYIIRDENAIYDVFEQYDFDQKFKKVHPEGRLTLDHPMLETMKEHLSQEIHALSRQAIRRDRDVEITLKMLIHPKKTEVKDVDQISLLEGLSEYHEFVIDYKLSATIKEIKADSKHVCGNGFMVFEGEDGNVHVDAIPKTIVPALTASVAVEPEGEPEEVCEEADVVPEPDDLSDDKIDKLHEVEASEDFEDDIDDDEVPEESDDQFNASQAEASADEDEVGDVDGMEERAGDEPEFA